MSVVLVITKPELQNVASVTEWGAEQRPGIRSVLVMSGVKQGAQQSLFLDENFKQM